MSTEKRKMSSLSKGANMNFYLKKALAWVIYIGVLAFILVGSTFLNIKYAHSAEAQFLDTGMSKEEFDAHLAPYVDSIVAAIYKAEGGRAAKKPFGILSVPCDGYEDCRAVAERTVRNNYVRWVKAGRPGDFIEFLGGRYAPVNVHPLNRHWVKNVNALMYPDNMSKMSKENA